MRLENSELRAFRAVVEEGGFKRAAQSLHISQSAVSQAVAGLESKLEAPLLHYGTKRTSLTVFQAHISFPNETISIINSTNRPTLRIL